MKQTLVLRKSDFVAPPKGPAADAPKSFRQALEQQRAQQRREEQRSLLDMFDASAVSILEHGGPDAERLLRRSADEFVQAALAATRRGEKINRSPLMRKAGASR